MSPSNPSNPSNPSCKSIPEKTLNNINSPKRNSMDNIQLQYNTDSISPEDAMVYKNLINNGYLFPIAEIRIDKDDIPKLKEKLKEYNLVTYDYSDHNSFSQLWQSKDLFLTVDGDPKNGYITSYTTSQELSQKIFKLLKTFQPAQEEMEIFFDTYYMQGQELAHSFKSFVYKDFKKTNEQYYPYIDTNAMFEQFYTNKENILILCGKPGVGKTSLTSQLLKYSLKNPDKIPYPKEGLLDEIDFLTVAYVKSTAVLAMDTFWRTLAQKEYDLVILDDLDYYLTPRSEEVQTGEDVERNKFINQFLSFTDGIEQNKTKFIITSNQDYTDIDTALLRKGRLFDILELRDLNNEEAQTIWKTEGLKVDKFCFHGNVLQADLGSEIEKAKNTKIIQRKYILKDGISKIKKPKKKLGF